MYICSTDKHKPAYIPAFERWSLYKSIWMNHWEEFRQIYDRRFLSKYGELSEAKIEEVEKLLGCGNFQNGFQRYSCEECDVNLIVPFSCKSRLCLSCYRKKLFGWSVNLSHILNLDLRHSHLVGTTAIIHKETKEVLHLSFLRYKKFAFSWMKTFCKHYEKEKVISKAESLVIQNKYKNGFHVYFQPIVSEEKEPLFRTSEYIASGFFHT